MNAADAFKSYSALLCICLAVAILGLLLAVILLFARNARSASAPMTGTAKETRRGGKRRRARNNAAQGKQTEQPQTARPEAEQAPSAQPFSDTDTIDLDADAEKTLPLSYTELGNRKPSGRFEITASELLVFTDEIIPCRGISKIGCGGV